MDTNTPTDLQLIDQINLGGEAGQRAFEALYRRHRDWCLRVAYRTCKDPEIAADAVQETFLYLLKKFPGFTLTAQLTTFLYPALVHNAQHAQRKARKHAQPAEAPPEPAEDQPATTAPDRRQEIATALTSLSPPHREAILLRFVDGLPIAHIARLQGVPEGTVKSRLHNALAQLREDPKTRAYFGVDPPS